MNAKLQLVLDKVSYFPGESVTATVKLCSELIDAALHGFSAVIVKDLSVHAAGVERSDPQWISKLYRPEFPADVIDARRVVRYIFDTEATQVLLNTPLARADSRDFIVRLKLPPQLPPSFKGSSVRFLYFLEARANIELVTGDEGTPNSTKEIHAYTVINVRPSIVNNKKSRLTSQDVPDYDMDVPLMDYKLETFVSKLKYEEVSGQEGYMLSKQMAGHASRVITGPISKQASGGHQVLLETELGDEDVSEEDDGEKDGHEPSSPNNFCRSVSGQLRRATVAGKSYILNLGETPLVKIMLQPPLDGYLQPGSTFNGVLDFRVQHTHSSAGPTPAMSCHQVVVMLETEEVINPEFRGSTRTRQNGVIRKMCCEHQELCKDTVLSHFIFSIPPYATPSFRTPMVSYRWLLRFELGVGPPIELQASERGFKAPRVQQLVWTLPIIVFPPTSLHGG